MNREIYYVSDFFSEQVLGGGELNDKELIQILIENGHKVHKENAHLVSLEILKNYSNCLFIISNFCNLKTECRNYLIDNLDYVIYEHDHKYLTSRNPAEYKNFKAPDREIVNYFFYKNAKKVFCQSNFHKDIIYKNLEINNLENISGNLWSLETLEFIRELSRNNKEEKCSIMNSTIYHKNTSGSIRYANSKSISYELIKSNEYHDFLRQLSKNDRFLFLPKTPETLSRVVVESRMLGCKVITNNLVGASGEEWFSKKGEELIDFMINKRQEIYSKIKSVLEEEPKKEKPLVSIITTFHDGKDFLEHFMKNITSQSIFNKCELVIVDAASSGKESEIIEEYKNKFSNIIYERLEEKLKPTPCINRAIKLSSGKCLNLALIDDVKSHNNIESLYKHLEDSDCSLVYGEVVQVSEANQNFEKHKESNSIFDHSRYEFSNENMVKCLPGPMPLWYSKVHNDCGLFDDVDCNYADDWEMWLRMVSRGHKFKKLNEKIGLYLVGGRSQQNDLEQRKEEAKIFFKYAKLFGSNFQKFAPYFKQFLG